MTSLLKTNNQAGFTLIEVLIAIVIFSFGILAVAAMQITSIQGNAKSRLTSEASNVAYSEMDRLLTLDFADVQLINTDNDGVLTDSTVATADGSNPNNPLFNNYNVFWNIVDDAPYAGVKTVGVVVTWNDRNVPRTLFLTNIKAQE